MEWCSVTINRAQLDLVWKKVECLTVSPITFVMKNLEGSTFCLMRFCCLSCLFGASLTASAGVMFIADAATVPQGSTAVIPITVSHFAGVTSFQFSLTWDDGAIQYSSAGNFGLNGLSSGSLNSSPGVLTVSWDDPDATGASLGDGNTLFSISFVASGASALESALAFGDVPLPRDVGVNFESVLFEATDGFVSITPVPEPVNVALITFVSILSAGAAVRRFRRNL
jgi:hypothetical protein